VCADRATGIPTHGPGKPIDEPARMRRNMMRP
jgi:hypothetical protein